MAGSKNPLIEQIEQLATPVLAELKMELVHMEFVHEHGQWVMRFFVDKEGGVTLDDCATVSEHMGRTLDATGLISQSYSLEVSSPGIYRPLRREKDFLRFVGERADITIFAPIEGRRHFKCTIKGVSQGNVLIEDSEQKPYEIPLEGIAKAKLDPEIHF